MSRSASSRQRYLHNSRVKRFFVSMSFSRPGVATTCSHKRRERSPVETRRLDDWGLGWGLARCGAYHVNPLPDRLELLAYLHAANRAQRAEGGVATLGKVGAKVGEDLVRLVGELTRRAEDEAKRA